MDIIVENYLKIAKSYLSFDAWLGVLSKFTYINPDYVNAIKFERSVTNIPHTIKSYKEDDKFFYFPRGGLKKIKTFSFFNNSVLVSNVAYKNQDEIENVLLKQDNWKLRNYQERIAKNYEAILPMKFFNGIICAPSGSGKTVIGAEAIRILKQPTLIIVPTIDILHQWYNTLTEKYIPQVDIDILHGSHNSVSYVKFITIGVVDSVLALIKRQVFKEYDKFFGMIILDECHHCPAPTFTEALTFFKARYILGLTATPFRTDKKDFLMFDYVGDIIDSVNDEELKKENIFMVPIVRFIYTDFYTPDISKDKGGYNKMIDNMIHNEERNKLIIENIKKDWINGHSILVITTRKEHGKILHKMLSDLYIKSEYLDSSTPKLKRQKIIEDMRTKKISILISTNLADEGLDIACLSSIHLVIPTKNQRLLIQRIGRIRRKDNTKTNIQVVDYVDDRVNIWRWAYYKRKNFYIKQNFILSNK